eukprot:m51a1_g982 hypothetical protein (509) ;mRNA; r:434928-441171
MAEPPLRRLTTIADVANNADGVMRVAFIGASGCGKSTTINALLATDAKKSDLSGPAQCRDPRVNNGTTSRVTAYLSGSQGCTLIDTVGFTDPRFTRAELIDSMYQTLYNSRIGFSHVVVVVANQVFTQEVRDLIDVYEKLFGSDFYNRAMLAVTHYDDDDDEEPTTLAAFTALGHSPQFLDFIRKFGDRVVVGSFQSEAILRCLEGMPSRELTIQLKMRNIREFFIWVLEKLRISGNKPEQQKIYEAFQYRQAMTPAARQDYDNAVVQASIIAISTLTRNRVIPTMEEAVQARTDCLEVMYFTTPFWDPMEKTPRLSARGHAMDGPKAMLNAVQSIKDKIKGAKQASKETSSASGDDAESSSSESIDELRGKKVVECNVDNDQEEHKEKTITRKRTREESNKEYQQDQIIKGLEAARAKLKEKIATYKKEQVRVTNELHEQHVLVATLKSQNEGLKEQLELLKSERANWREYESLKGTSTTPFKHKVPTSHPAHPASGSADGADTPTC